MNSGRRGSRRVVATGTGRGPAPFVHLELHTGAGPEAEDLYREVLGWRAREVTLAGRGYRSLGAGGELAGGIVECAPRRSLWLPYAEVRSVSAATERARELGATVILEPGDGPSGRRSVIATSAGAELALWEAATSPNRRG